MLYISCGTHFRSQLGLKFYERILSLEAGFFNNGSFFLFSERKRKRELSLGAGSLYWSSTNELRTIFRGPGCAVMHMVRIFLLSTPIEVVRMHLGYDSRAPQEPRNGLKPRWNG